MKILVIYDGTIKSKTALRYGLGKAKEIGGELLVLQVFQNSLFVDYDAGPRAEEIARAEAALHLSDAETLIRDTGNRGLPSAFCPRKEILLRRHCVSRKSNTLT